MLANEDSCNSAPRRRWVEIVGAGEGPQTIKGKVNIACPSPAKTRRMSPQWVYKDRNKTLTEIFNLFLLIKFVLSHTSGGTVLESNISELGSTN